VSKNGSTFTFEVPPYLEASYYVDFGRFLRCTFRDWADGLSDEDMFLGIPVGFVGCVHAVAMGAYSVIYLGVFQQEFRIDFENPVQAF
jgi:hypothetical protein